MKFTLKNGCVIRVRPYQDTDFPAIQDLNKEEGWNNLVEQGEETRKAWRNSNVAFVVEEKGKVIGYVRGLTDRHITLYVCELLIHRDYRGLGIGQILLQYVHHLYPKTKIEMLASSTSRSFYEQLGVEPSTDFERHSKGS